MALSAVFLILIVLPVLCLVVAVSALVGDRLLRHGRRFIGFVVTAVGYAALACGALLLFLWASYGHFTVRAPAPRVTVWHHVTRTAEDTAKPANQTEAEAGKEAEKDRSVTAGATVKKKATGVHDSERKRDGKARPSSPKTASKKPNDSAARKAVPPAPKAAPEGAKTEPKSARDIELTPKAYIDFDARPEWVDSEEDDFGPIHRIAVASGPFMRAREARNELSKQLKIETDRYINRLIGNDRAARWLDYDEAEIRARFIAPDCVYDEKVVSPSFGVMHQSHALLQFGPEFRQEVQARWHGLLALGRLAEVGVVAVGVLGVLAILFGYFRLDTATRGFYTGRLRFFAAVAILGLVVVAVVVARSIPWFWL